MSTYSMVNSFFTKLLACYLLLEQLYGDEIPIGADFYETFIICVYLFVSRLVCERESCHLWRLFIDFPQRYFSLGSHDVTPLMT